MEQKISIRLKLKKYNFLKKATHFQSNEYLLQL
jgi:hypothetical protein